MIVYIKVTTDTYRAKILGSSVSTQFNKALEIQTKTGKQKGMRVSSVSDLSRAHVTGVVAERLRLSLPRTNIIKGMFLKKLCCCFGDRV